VVLKLAAQAGLESYEVVHECFSATRFMERAAQCALFLGMKLHAVILAIAAGAPTVALEYQPKLGDFMASIHAEEHLLRFDSITAERLIGKVESLQGHLDEVAWQQWNACRMLKIAFTEYLGQLRRTLTGQR
jgi:polysaccharide pyruvyl transferase WcaK-like protein